VNGPDGAPATHPPARTASPARLRQLAAQGIQERFPGVCLWYGESTGHWWAVVDRADGARLLEGQDAGELSGRILGAYAPTAHDTHTTRRTWAADVGAWGWEGRNGAAG
jgi:hypothetical protein